MAALSETENLAVSHASTGSARVDLFFKTVRGINSTSLRRMLNASWEENALDTLRLIFQTRHCRGGKGEKAIFHESMHWLIDTGKTRHLEANFAFIPEYGSWKDLLSLLDTPLRIRTLNTFASQLKKDKIAMNEASGSDARPSISLCAKWAPTEKGARDRKEKVVKELATLLCTNEAGYRKEYLVPLREHLRVVESLMCTGKWSDINFAGVPSIAHHKYRKAFSKHDESRYCSYLEAVKAGKTDIKAGVMEPHILVAHYLKHGVYNETIELQWKSLVQHVRDVMAAKGGVHNSLSVVDVSGSMNGVPMQVAIALGLMFSELCHGRFHNKFITFSESPRLTIVNGGNLRDQVENMSNASWGMSTNLQSVFDLILGEAVRNSIHPDQMPHTLFIFSDMQFNVACPANDRTNFRIIEEKYRDAGYRRPRIVFWNLRSNTVDFPVERNVPDTALLSGFSPMLMKLVLQGEKINPYSIMRVAIDDRAYSRIHLAE